MEPFGLARQSTKSHPAGPVGWAPAGAAWEGLWERVLAASPDAVVVADETGVIQAASPALERLFGHAVDDIIGQPIELLVPTGTGPATRGIGSTSPTIRSPARSALYVSNLLSKLGMSRRTEAAVYALRRNTKGL